MTTKQIAEAVGRDITTVQRWIKRLDGKMPSIDCKMQSSTSTNPADFDLEETIKIIEIGLGKNAASLYRQNADQINAVSRTTLTAKDIEIIERIVAAVVGRKREVVKSLPKPVYMTPSEASLFLLYNSFYYIKGKHEKQWRKPPYIIPSFVKMEDYQWVRIGPSKEIIGEPGKFLRDYRIKPL